MKNNNNEDIIKKSLWKNQELLSQEIYASKSKYHNLTKGCCCSVAKSCPAPCDPVDCSIPGFPVFHYLLEFSRVHFHWDTHLWVGLENFKTKWHTEEFRISTKFIIHTIEDSCNFLSYFFNVRILVYLTHIRWAHTMSKVLCSVIWSIERKDMMSSIRNMPS